MSISSNYQFMILPYPSRTLKNKLKMTKRQGQKFSFFSLLHDIEISISYMIL